ncbi:hypothetical protein MJH54_34190, partial [Salmonella enterica subsp. enterica serovar Montevideo]|nr:hypothetical protein [Salmonella enterica subsp. enterica serovar Montevideo]
TPLWIVTSVRNFMRHRDHIADHGAFAHNVRISTDIRRAWRVLRRRTLKSQLLIAARQQNHYTNAELNGVPRSCAR